MSKYVDKHTLILPVGLLIGMYLPTIIIFGICYSAHPQLLMYTFFDNETCTFLYFAIGLMLIFSAVLAVCSEHCVYMNVLCTLGSIPIYTLAWVIAFMYENGYINNQILTIFVTVSKTIWNYMSAMVVSIKTIWLSNTNVWVTIILVLSSGALISEFGSLIHEMILKKDIKLPTSIAYIIYFIIEFMASLIVYLLIAILVTFLKPDMSESILWLIVSLSAVHIVALFFISDILDDLLTKDDDSFLETFREGLKNIVNNLSVKNIIVTAIVTSLGVALLFLGKDKFTSSGLSIVHIVFSNESYSSVLEQEIDVSQKGIYISLQAAISSIIIVLIVGLFTIINSKSKTRILLPTINETIFTTIIQTALVIPFSVLVLSYITKASSATIGNSINVVSEALRSGIMWLDETLGGAIGSLPFAPVIVFAVLLLSLIIPFYGIILSSFLLFGLLASVAVTYIEQFYVLFWLSLAYNLFIEIVPLFSSESLTPNMWVVNIVFNFFAVLFAKKYIEDLPSK